MTESKVAIVTGGSEGIGASCVRKFLESGWGVSLLALTESSLTQSQSERLLSISGDVTSDVDRRLIVQQTLEKFGRIDVLVNNAGIGLYAFPSEVPCDQFQRLLDVNTVAPLAMAQLVIPAMLRHGTGTIVNIESVVGFVSLPWAAAYCASKAALHSLHDSLRRELRATPIHVARICPGIVSTKFREHVLSGEAPSGVRDIKRVVSPDAVADGVMRAIKHRSKTVFVPRIGALFSTLGILVPSLMDFYLSRFASAPTPRGNSGSSPELEAGSVRESCTRPSAKATEPG